MTNIEKLYELAGIKRSEYYLVYPPFTYTKQLRLIKWIDYFSYFSTGGDFHMQCHLKDKQYHKIGFVSFEDTLASLMCELWNDLTDVKREEIREILQ